MKSDQIYRRQVIDEAAKRLIGEVHKVSSIRHYVAVYLIVFCVLVLFSLALYIEFPRTETVVGRVVDETSSLRVAAARSGVVVEVMVQNGDTVRKDQTVALISTPSDANGFNARQSEASLNSQLSSTERQIDALRSLELIDEKSYAVKKSRLKSDLLSAREIRLLNNTIKLRKSQKLRTRWKYLADKGIISQSTYEKYVDEYLEISSKILDADKIISELERDIVSIDLEKSKTIWGNSQKLEELEQKKSSIRQTIQKNYENHYYKVQALGDGVISNVGCRSGDMIEEGKLLFIINDPHDKLEAEIFVPPRAAGFLEIGKKVRIIYDAYPADRYGIATATLYRVSSDTIPASAAAKGLGLEGPTYRTLATLDDQYVHRRGSRTLLRPGLSFKGHIVTETHTVLSWLFSPEVNMRTWSK